MKRITEEQATAGGYRAITTDIWPERESEKHIVTSIESAMAGLDAVWIIQPNDSLQAARKTTELILTRELLNKHAPLYPN